MSVELEMWALVRQVTKLLATKGIVQDEAAEWKLYSDGADVTDYTHAEGYRVGQHGGA